MAERVMLGLGEFRFEVSTLAYQKFSLNQSWRWPEQARINRDPALQFVGRSVGEIELDGVIYPSFKGGIDERTIMVTAWICFSRSAGSWAPGAGACGCRSGQTGCGSHRVCSLSKITVFLAEGSMLSAFKAFSVMWSFMFKHPVPLTQAKRLTWHAPPTQVLPTDISVPFICFPRRCIVTLKALPQASQDSAS